MKKRHFFWLLLAAFLLSVLPEAASATTQLSSAYMFIEGEFQGHIEGGVIDGPYEGWIYVEGVEHVVEIPVDPSGNPIGNRIHHPFKVVMSADRSQPKLMQALVTGEPLVNVEVEFLSVNPQGQEVNTHTTRLEMALLIYHGDSADSVSDPQPHTITLQFVYEEICWYWIEDNIEFCDQWLWPTPVGQPSSSPGMGQSLALLPASPNPTRGETRLQFELPSSRAVELQVFDLRGRKLRDLVQGVVPDGLQSVLWDGRNARGEAVSSGMYIVRLSWPGGGASRPVTVVR